jgi:hypothetical protein
LQDADGVEVSHRPLRPVHPEPVAVAHDPFLASSDAGAFGEGLAFEPDGVALEAAGFALRIALCARSLALAEHDGFMAVELIIFLILVALYSRLCMGTSQKRLYTFMCIWPYKIRHRLC